MKVLHEGGLSRLWQHTHGSDTFVIVGSQDKDTKKDRTSELRSLIFALSDKYNKKGLRIGYKWLRGSYTYESGEIAEENSAIIYGITRDDALNLCRKLNQETIIWKDADFFGFLKPDGTEDGTLSTDTRNMILDQAAVDEFGSRLAGRNGKNSGKKFAFKFEQLMPSHTGSSLYGVGGRNTGTYEVLFEKMYI